MASVRKVELAEGSVRWRVRVFMGRDAATGKRKYVTRTFNKKKRADREARRLEEQKGGGALLLPSKEPLSKFLTSWLDNVKEGRVRARTLHDYRGMIRRYVLDPPEGAPPIGSIRLDRLAPAAFEALYAFLWKEESLSPRTLQYLHAILRQALGYAVRTGALIRNPTDAVRPPRQSKDGSMVKRKVRAMTRTEATAFLKAASEDGHAALWTVLLMGGLRPSEALGLTWEDVDLDDGRLHVRRSLTRRGQPKVCECGHLKRYHEQDGEGVCAKDGCEGCARFSGTRNWKLVEPKTARARRVVILPDVATASLRLHKAEQARARLQLGGEYQRHDLVFATTLGTPLDLANLYRVFKAVLQRANLGSWEGEGEKRVFVSGFRLYDLRHSCATLLLLAGENPKVVSERLGHASVTLTLDTYSHVLPSMQEESARRLEAMFGAIAEAS